MAHPTLRLELGILSVATVSTLVVLLKGQQLGWFTSNFIAFATAVAILGYVLYILSELRSKTKLVDLSVFLRPNFFISSVVFLLVLGFSMYALFYAILLCFEFPREPGTFKTGLLPLPFAVSIAIFSLVSGVMSDRWSAEAILFLAIGIGVYIGSIFFVLRHYDLYTPESDASVGLAFVGVGMGLFFCSRNGHRPEKA